MEKEGRENVGDESCPYLPIPCPDNEQYEVENKEILAFLFFLFLAPLMNQRNRENIKQNIRFSFPPIPCPNNEPYGVKE